MVEEILTIEDVARYLRVTESAVYDWAQKGDIPSGKFGSVWRFKKRDIESWVNDRLSVARDRPRFDSAHVKSALSQDRVIFIKSVEKRAAIMELITNLSSAPQIKNPAELSDEIFRREEIMSSAIGKGIAIPHVRLASVTDLVLSVGISKTSVTGFNALDERPVRVLLLIAAAKNQHSFYLQTLSYFATLLKNQNVFQALLSAKSELEAYQILTE